MKRLFKEIFKNRIWYLFILPDMLLFTLFIIYPLIRTIYGSFFKWRLNTGSEFVGLVNYANLIHDTFFITSFLKTFLFALVITPLSIVLGLVAALLVDRLKGTVKYLSRLAIFTPYICSLIVASVIWKSFLQPDGLIQSGLAMIGIATPFWLSDPDFSVLAVILMTTWQSMGFNMIFYLAGLQGIPHMFYEAAMVDGAPPWMNFWLITLPLLQRTTVFLIVINTLNNFKMFDQVMGLTRGGPMNATMTTMVFIYQKAFSQNLFGPASAAAIVFALAIFAVSAFQMRLLRSQVQY